MSHKNRFLYRFVFLSLKIFQLYIRVGLFSKYGNLPQRKKYTQSKNHYLFNYFIASKASDKLSRRGHSEVPLEVNTPAIPALLHQMQS